jgi:ApbE superfamily uncharacterized protein (UPF0280 family)
MIYNQKHYRLGKAKNRWDSKEIKFETSDLYIKAQNINEIEIKEHIISLREEIRNEEKNNANFITSLQPLQINNNATDLVLSMYRAAEIAGTGPMAAVAGAVAEFCGEKVLENNDEVIVENGGDIWCSLKKDAIVGVYPGGFYFKDPIGLNIEAKNTPCGICTSSGVIGKSLSFGKADAAVVIGKNASLADAVATEACNIVQDENKIEEALNYAMNCNGITGILIIYKELLAAKGSIELSS